MVTDCGGMGFWDLSNTEPVFLHGTFLIMTVAVPAAICVAIWKLRMANRRLSRPLVSILGLNDKSEGHNITESWALRVSPLNLFLYSTTALVTFTLGLLSMLLRESIR